MCFVEPDGASRVVVDELAYPNGIVLRPDGGSLVVGEFGKNRVLEYSLVAPGQVGEMRVLADLPDGGEILTGPDGMALDRRGRLYIAQYGQGAIRVVDPGGDLVESLRAGNMGSSNVAFGGDRMDALFTTGGGAGLGAEGLASSTAFRCRMRPDSEFFQTDRARTRAPACLTTVCSGRSFAQRPQMNGQTLGGQHLGSPGEAGEH